MLPVDRFLTFIKQNQLFNTTDKVLLAVSGGRDSMLMVALFNAASLNFGIAHCNFNLRGNESDDDERLVRSLAETLQVPFHHTSFQTKDFAAREGVSVEMAARELRYQWFEQVRTTESYQYIAVAHHLSDSTETVLLNLTRGTGLAGLHGIRPKRGAIVRPLMFLTREQIDEIARHHGLLYRDDSSNLTCDYSRNKLRHKVVPALKEMNPSLESTMADFCRRISEVEEFLKLHIDSRRKELFRPGGSDGSIHIPLEALKALKPLKLLLFELFKPFHFTEAVLNDLTLAWGGQPGKLFESVTHLLLLDRNQVILRPKTQPDKEEILISTEGGLIRWNGKCFNGYLAIPSQVIISKNNKIAYFDANLLQFPLKLRLWRKGDYFYPFGMKGKKKVSDFFTSLKLSRFDKTRIPVLENGNGEILWVAGYRSDNRYKITPRTKKVFILEHLNNHEQ